MGSKQLSYCFAQGFAYGDYEQSTAKKRTKRGARHCRWQR